MLSDDAKLFKALGDDTRLSIVGFLLKKDHCACDFSGTNKDQTTISRHLKVLTEAGIVKFERRGRNMIYSIASEAIAHRLRAMGIEEQDRCCDGQDGLNRTKQVVKKKYRKIALEGGSCGCGPKCCGDEEQSPIKISATLGYTKEDLSLVPASNLGLGCGNPVALGSMKEGETILDLGSGAGMDAFLAANRVGLSGKVIGVDFTKEMVKKARRNALDYSFSNVEFRYGDIENLPVNDSSVDVVMSNCVINLVPDKQKAFNEAFRVLRPGGRMYLSDMVLLEELTAEQRADEDLISGCVGGAVLKDEYLELIATAGFQVEKVDEDKKSSKKQHMGLPVESLKVVAIKPTG